MMAGGEPIRTVLEALQPPRRMRVNLTLEI